MRQIVDSSSVPLDTRKIRELRQALKLTQEQAAERAGLPGRQRWNDVESGRGANVTIETLERIARALGVRAKDLLR